MRILLAILISWPLLAMGASRYVSTNGVDTGSAGSWATAWRTLAYAEANASSGDTIHVGEGSYGEAVDVAGIYNLTWIGYSNATTRSFRFQTASNSVSSFRILSGQGDGLLYASGIRLEAAAHWAGITNCTIGNVPWVSSTNFWFDDTTATITCSNLDFAASGFRTNCYVYWGGCSLEQYHYSNLGGYGRIRNFPTTNSMQFDPGTIIAETNNGAWAIVYPVTAGDSTGWRGIKGVVSASAGATNVTVTGCTLTNFMGIPLEVYGDSWTVQNNEVVNCPGGSGMRIGGSNHRILNNYFHDCYRPIRYASFETISHTGAGDFYDFIGAYIHMGSHAVTWNTNVLFAYNWFQNIEQPMGTISGRFVSNDNYWYGHWSLLSNVWVNCEGVLDGGVNDMTVANNTFYRSPCGVGTKQVISFGSSGITNMTITSNLFVNAGDHSTLGAENGYGFSYTGDNGVFGTILTNYNLVVGPEVTGFTNCGFGPEVAGLRGINPLFRNEGSALGADGVPFTADDGLKPLSTSPVAGWGALTATTGLQPSFYASVPASGFGWFEPTGTNFNTAWNDLKPWERTTQRRPYTTPDPLPNIPQFVTFSATNTVSSTWSTTNWPGITGFSWDFGDGGRAVWTRWPDVSHTFLLTGAVTMTLTVTNSAGATASTTRGYVINGPTNTFTGHIIYATTNGNDSTGDGSWTTPYASATNVMKHLGPGDYGALVCISDTNYIPNSMMTWTNGTLANPITLVGYGATMDSVNWSKAYWRWEGIEWVSTNNGTVSYSIINNQTAGMQVRNCYFHDSLDTVGAVSSPLSGGVGGADFLLVNNEAYHLGPQSYVFGIFGNNAIQDANIVTYCSRQADCHRWDGDGGTISRNYALNFCYTNENHADWISYSISAGVTNRNLLIERNWIEYTDAYTNQVAALCNSGADQAHSLNYTNVVWRNNVVIKTYNTFNPLGLDGAKLYNNGFYSCGIAGNVMTYGGSGGDLYGLDFANNLFYDCGTGASSTGWYLNTASDGPGAASTFTRMDYNYVGPSAKDTAPPDSVLRWASLSTEAHGINGGDPSFIDAANGDYRIATNSILATAGVDLSAVFTTDFFGVPRGSEWSIGPFQPGAPAAAGAPAAVRVGVLRVLNWRGR